MYTKNRRLCSDVHPNHLFAAGTDADEGDRDANEVTDETQVLACCGWQVVFTAGVDDLAITTLISP